MGEILSYSLSVSLIVMVLFPVMHLIVNHSTYFRFNRIVILGGFMLAFVLPCLYQADIISFRTDVSDSNIGDILNPALSGAQVASDNGSPARGAAMPWLPIVFIIYWSGIAVLFCREICSFCRLFRMISLSEKKKRAGVIVCRITDKTIAPFSWGKYIFLLDSEFDSSGGIFIHEKTHILRKHWIDILFADLLCILLWYNPFAWMARQLMKLNHEFEADEAVINSGTDAYDYQCLLLARAMGNRLFPGTNSLASGKRGFRKRILIMGGKRSSKKSMLIALCTVPAVTLAGAVLSMPVSSGILSDISGYRLSEDLLFQEIQTVSSEQDLIVKDDPSEAVTDSISIIPSPFDDQTALADIIKLSIETIQFEKNTKVNIEIVVDKDGSVKDVIADSPDGADIAAAIQREFNGFRFEQMTDNGQPVEVHFNIPLRIKKSE